MKLTCLDWSNLSYRVFAQGQQSDSALWVETIQIPNGETWYVRKASAYFIWTAASNVQAIGEVESGLFLCPPGTPTVPNTQGISVAQDFTARVISLPLGTGESVINIFPAGFPQGLVAGFTSLDEFFVIPQEWTMRAILWQGGAGALTPKFSMLALQYFIDRKQNGGL